MLGAEGFVGRNVLADLQHRDGVEVAFSSRGDAADHKIDLLDRQSIGAALDDFNPSVIVNCAGIVANNEGAANNIEFCRNIFEEIISRNEPYPKVITTGSAAEYGVVGEGVLVSEDTPLRAESMYGKSKIEEGLLAKQYAEEYGVDVTVARVFNPIGPGMGEKFLLTSLLKQISELRDGQRDVIELSRLDSKRDYVDIRDVAHAIGEMATLAVKHSMYVNIGSGKSTSNGELLDELLSNFSLPQKPTIIETAESPEPAYAACADISRIKSEYGWTPRYNLATTVRDIIHG